MTEPSDTPDHAEDPEWPLLRAYLESATSAQWHIYAARSNYDGNAQELHWLIDQPALDEATARMIYWNLGAAWHVAYADESEVPGYELDSHRLIRRIEQRVLSGFYRSPRIWYDPLDNDMASPADYPDRAIRRPIPDPLLDAVGTDEYVDLDDPDYDEGIPLALMERLLSPRNDSPDN